MIVEDLITRSPLTVGREDSVAEAALHMKEADVGSVVVLGEAGDVVGIVTFGVGAALIWAEVAGLV